MSQQSEFFKDPDALLDYYFDWAALTNGTGDSDWLAAGETITAFDLTADAGITIVDAPAPPALTNDNTAVAFWLSGGTGGRIYVVTCQVTTSAGRVDERSMSIRVIER